MHTLNLLPWAEFQETYITSGRIYRTPEGMWYQSVTTYLKHVLPESEQLKKWKVRVGPEEAAAKMTRGSKRGTTIHKFAECYLQGKPFPVGMPLHQDLFNQLKIEFDKHLSTVYGFEAFLYSHLFRLAGRADIIGKWNGDLSIIDIKTTTNTLYPDALEKHLLQAAAYAHLFHAVTKGQYKIKNLVIVVALEAGPPAIVEVRPAKNYLLHFLDIWKANPPQIVA